MVYIPPVQLPPPRQDYSRQLHAFAAGPGETIGQIQRENTQRDQWEQGHQFRQNEADRRYALDLQQFEAGGGADGYYGTPLYTQDAEGNVSVFQLSKGGAAPRAVDFGEQRVLVPTTNTDLGDRVLTTDKYGNRVRVAPKGGAVGEGYVPTEVGPDGEVLEQAPRPGSKAAREEDEYNRERGEAKTKARISLNGTERQAQTVNTKIDQVSGAADEWTTGWGQLLFGQLPASAQRKLRNDIDTIKANVGFDKLQRMREASPTGGALGQVSEFENRLLQAVEGSLDPLQSPEDLKANLEMIRRRYAEAVAAHRIAYMTDFEGLDRQVADQAIAAIEAGKDPAAVLQRVMDMQ